MQDDEVRQLVRKAVQKALGTSSPAPTEVTRRYALSGRKLITESDLSDVASGSEIAVPAGALITPLARDLVHERRLKLVTDAPSSSPATPQAAPDAPSMHVSSHPDKTVALGADHGGFALKEDLKGYLQELGYEVLDCGTSNSESVDYPDFAYAVAKLVSDGRAANGIIVDGAGIGSCMAANKVPGVRAALCYDLSTAVNSREHNHANVLTLGGGLVGVNLARQIAETWLNTAFGSGRHARRVSKIMAIEERFLKK